MRRVRTLLWTLVCLCVAARASSGQGQTQPSQANEQVIYVAEQVSLKPGYAVGDIAIANPNIADFRVLAGRKELLLVGKTQGRTTLILWDQSGVRRAEILIHVTTREAAKLERDLRDLLKDFPSVRAAPLGDTIIVAGEVSSQSDLAAIQSIAEAAGVKSTVRYVPPTPVDTLAKDRPATAPAAKEDVNTPPPPPEPAAPPAPGPAPGSATGLAKYRAVEYEIRIIEASTGFGSGTYSQGVEPSGATLVSRTVQAPIGSPLQVEIMDPKLEAKLKKSKDTTPKGLRLRFTPSVPEDDGRFTTNLELETNLPYDSKAYDPSLWRRARWQVSSASGEPIGVAGADLLAVLPENQGGGSVLGTLQRATSMASGFGLPGTNYSNAFYYDPVKKTQLLMLIRPRLLPRKTN